MKQLRRSSKILALVLAGGAALAACAESGTVKCKVGADCASGICNADGSCQPVSTTTGDGGTGGTPSTGGGGAGGTSSDGGGGTGGTGGSGLCSPNQDGTITAEEVPLGAGLSATFQVATNPTFDTTGAGQPGSKVWDFTPMLSGDHKVLAETLPIEGAWYANDFAGATYATRLSDSADLLGVFEVTADALLLRGVVSPEDGVTATNLSYEPPVSVLSFPMKEGDTWETTATVTGLASGVFSVYTETYVSEVDASGTAITPYSDFPVLRVGTDLTRVVGGFVTTTRTYAFVTECFGSVANVASQINELSVEFTDPAEVRRLSP